MITRKERWADLIYRIFTGIVTMFVAFVIGWYAASRYTLSTLQVWYQPETDQILVQDYMGNIDEHIFSWE